MKKIDDKLRKTYVIQLFTQTQENITWYWILIIAFSMMNIITFKDNGFSIMSQCILVITIIFSSIILFFISETNCSRKKLVEQYREALLNDYAMEEYIKFHKKKCNLMIWSMIIFMCREFFIVYMDKHIPLISTIVVCILLYFIYRGKGINEKMEYDFTLIKQCDEFV